MYQQNPINPRQAEAQAHHFHLNEQDTANLVLSELKRAAREYTTAALEATHPVIRQTFAGLTQKTLQDQAELFDVLSQINGYGSISMATQQEVQQELQQHIRKAEQLHSVVQQAIQSGSAYQQPIQQAAIQQPFQSGHTAGAAGYGNQGVASSGASSYTTGGSLEPIRTKVSVRRQRPVSAKAFTRATASAPLPPSRRKVIMLKVLGVRYGQPG